MPLLLDPTSKIDSPLGLGTPVPTATEQGTGAVPVTGVDVGGSEIWVELISRVEGSSREEVWFKNWP